MNTTTKILFTLLALGLIISCSRKKNTWLSRNYHAMGTYYNTLYNGNLALQQGKQSVIQGYFDNYWEVLPVERMQVKEETLFNTDTTTNQDFARAEEKATKAIQKHSILIDGEQYNYQIDEAFLLLGKARYFDQRFVPALAAFNYILNTVPDSSTTVPARVWKAKTQLRMDYPELALQNLREMLEELSVDTTLTSRELIKKLDKQDNLKDEHLAAISATMAQAYINLGKTNNAVTAISMAAKKTEDNEERGRYLYIKGQLYDAKKMNDSANAAFDEIIALKRRTPRVYRIHAFMEKIKNTKITEENRLAMLEHLTELAENRENRPYLDNIYYQFAEYYFELDSVETAMVYYNKSLREDSPDRYLVSRDYLTLGNINFDGAHYEEAGAYYDSTLANLVQNTREYRELKKKRDNLDDVILYEGIAEKNDSILNLVAMTENERLTYFTEYTEEKKDQAFENAMAALEKAQAAKQNTGAGQFFNANNSGPNNQTSGSFYFYETTRVAYGKLGFKNIWGDRPLQDNWRTDESGAKQNDSKEKTIELTEEAILANLNTDPKFDPATYISKIPTDPKVIDSLKSDRNFAYYQLGVIYKEKFEEYELAAAKLEALLKNEPEKRLILPAKYNLYKIYGLLEKPAKANRWKQDILNNHPNSRYAAIILNPREFQAGANSPEAVYKRVYKKYQDQQFQLVIDKSEKYSKKFTGDPIVPKFELLKATATGRLLGFEAYKKALNNVALMYPLSEEGKKAQRLYENAIPALADKEFKKDQPSDSYKLIYVFPNKKYSATMDSLRSKTDSINLTIESLKINADSLNVKTDSLKLKKDPLWISGDSLQVSADSLQIKLNRAITKLGFSRLSTSIDIYNPKKIFLVVHGLDSKLGARGFGEKLKKNKEYKIKKPFFAISSRNYKIILIHKNLKAYLQSTLN